MSQDNDNNFLFSDDLTDEELEQMLAELVPNDSSSVDDNNAIVDTDTTLLSDLDTGNSTDGLQQDTTLDETIADEDFVFELEDMLDGSEDLDVQETIQPTLNPSQIATDEQIVKDSLEDFKFELPEKDVALEDVPAPINSYDAVNLSQTSIEDFSIDAPAFSEPAPPKVERQPEVDFTDATLQEAAFEEASFKEPTLEEPALEEASFKEAVSEKPILEETEDTTATQFQKDKIEPVYNLVTDLENNSEVNSDNSFPESHHNNHYNIDENNLNTPSNTSATSSNENTFKEDTSLTCEETTSEAMSEPMSESRSIKMPKIQAEITPEMIAKKKNNSTFAAPPISETTSEPIPESHATTSPIAALEPVLQSKLQTNSNLQTMQPLESNNEVTTPNPIDLSTKNNSQNLALAHVTDVDIGELSHIEHHTRLLKTYLNEIEAPFLAANQVSTQLIREVRQLQKAQRGQYKNTHAQTHELRTKLITARKHFIELLSIVDLVEENLESEHCEQIHYTE